MNLKSILLIAAATIGLYTATLAQVPNYIPTNGLVGWWPFNGNANDESGNVNNGTVNGATLTNDRFGMADKAYSFDGVDDFIQMINSGPTGNTNVSISFWMSTTMEVLQTPQGGVGYIFSYGANDINQFGRSLNITVNGSAWSGCNQGISFDTYGAVLTNTDIFDGNWNFYTVINDTSLGNNVVYQRIFKNGALMNELCYSSMGVPPNPTNFSNATPIKIGAFYGTVCANCQVQNQLYFNGRIDDIAIYNRVLTQQEITNLYTATNCANNTNITPQINSLTNGNTATFSATTSDPNPTFVWQSDFGQGFQTLNNFGNYSGVNTNSLSIANVQLSEHNQPIRVITTSGNCIDTSNVAVINLIDTCIAILTINDTITTQVFDTTYVTQTIYDTLQVTIYDTLLTAVTDTLIINSLISGLNPPNNLNTLKLFPNPASTHITIDYGNFNAMSGYTLTIVNSIGQIVFTTPINQQTSFVDLSTWTGNGIYFVKLIDPQNNIIENRKIVIQ